MMVWVDAAAALAADAAVPLTAACAYPLLVLALRRVVASAAASPSGLPYATDGGAIRTLVCIHNTLLCVASVVMAFGAILSFATDHPYTTLEEFFCLSAPDAPAIPPSLRLWLRLFHYSKYVWLCV